MKILKEWRYKSGVYKITNTVNSKTYVGSSKEVYNRLSTYKCLFKRGKVHNKHLQSSFNKYGIKNFLVEIIEFCEENLKEREQYWIDFLKPEYNKRTNVDFNYQISPSQETRDKISKSLKEAFKNGRKRIDRVQAHSLKVSLFTLEGELIKRFESVGLLAEHVGYTKYSSYIARATKTKSFKFKKHLICLTVDEGKVRPYSEYKKERYKENGRKITERNKTKRSNTGMARK